MLNQVVLVGRLVRDPELRETSDGKSVTNITLAVSRNYKNSETGEYETDFLKATLWSGIAENTVNYTKKGSVLGIKGRVISRSIETEDGKKYNCPEIVAEKVTFISTKKDEE